MTDQQPQKISLDSLHPQQLMMIKKEIEEEYLLLTQSQSSLKLAHQKFSETKTILGQLKDKFKSGNEILVPITNSLYVNGIVEDTENVLIDYGTGYFVERNTVQAQKYCERKMTFLEQHLVKINSLLGEKKLFMEQLSIEFQRKVMQIQQLQQQQQQQQQSK